MSIAVEERISPQVKAMAVFPRELSSMAPWEIRIAIAELVKENKMDLAVAASESALALFPDSQDVLVISSLLAEVRSDWPRAEQLLIQLLTVQGADAPAESWLHLVRTLKCQNKTEDMALVIDHILNCFSSDALVAVERDTLLALRAESTNNA